MLRSDKTFGDMVAPTIRLTSVVRALRVEQWVKNLLLFLPLLMAPEVGRLSLYNYALLAFLSFSLSASAVYVLNDLVDLEADRRHAR